MEILFVLRLNQTSKEKPATIYCRITLNGVRANGDFSTFIKVQPKDWNAKFQKILDRPGADQDNETLENIRNSIKDLYNEAIRKGRPVTAQGLKQDFLKGTKPSKCLLEVFNEFIERKRAKKAAIGTIKHNLSKMKNLRNFLTSIGRIDLLPDEFGFKFADNFEFWLQLNLSSCSHNYAMKHLQLIKGVLNFAARQQYITANPLQYLELTYEKPKLPVFLSPEELASLENYRFASASLQKAADIYTFQCYTGFAYVDYMSFHPDQHLQKELTGNGKYTEFIYMDRTKSGETAILPFFSKARRILTKYNGKLPKLSNQVYNRFLKEVAQLLNIKKKLTTHTARKTAAMNWLNAGVPEETVARMLGHNSTKQLKVYARVQLSKIAEDTKVLFNK